MIELGVAVLTRAPSDPGGKTRLREERAFVTALQTGMLADTLAGLEALGTRSVFVAPAPGAVAEVVALAPGWTVREQRGATLTERLLDAVEAMLSTCKGVVVTGSDAPLVGEALRDLGVIATDEVVLVPSDDGGYAAIALARLEPRLFLEMPWSTDRVADETRARAVAAGMRVRELPGTFDVDEPGDLARLRAELTRAPWRAPRTAAALGINVRPGGPPGRRRG